MSDYNKKKGDRLTTKCRICKEGFEKSPDKLIICKFKKGAVHFGCCISKCSMDNQPCEHMIGMYEKISDKN